MNENIKLSPVDLAIINESDFDAQKIASIYGVPPELLSPQCSFEIPKIMITALMRVHPGREQLATRAFVSASINGCSVLTYAGESVSDYSYNLYCNELKSQVDEGYFFFLDSDDVVIPGAIQKIIPYLREDKALIVQMLRNGRPKPRNGLIERGKIGLPCIILHSKWKNIADVGDKEDSDYKWIKDVTDQIGYEFVPIPLVDAGKRNRGK